jgi:hypothetical protein
LNWDQFWDPLLDLIEQGFVVPMVSKDLLQTSSGELLYPSLAKRLAQVLKVPWHDELVQGAELNNVACRYLEADPKNTIGQVYSALYGVARAAQTSMGTLPSPLLKLAEIRPFRLFITTTFDPYLARALDQVRFKGQAKTKVLAYSLSKREERTVPVMAPGVPTVYHLLGKMSVVSSDYAVTQWEIVEYFHALQSAVRPNLLFDELRNRSLLILGSSFDGWLARFFLRLAKEGSGGTADYIADPLVQNDNSLVLFIRRFSREVEIYGGCGGPVEFVDELHKRWKERHPADEENFDQPPPPAYDVEQSPIFLSYATENLECAKRLSQSIDSMGVPVFFDRGDQGLKLGDAWEFELEQHISKCSYFMPLISRDALVQGERYVKVEWNAAIRRAEYRHKHEIFIVPVIIDDTDPDDLAIPKSFRSAQWIHLPEGIPTDGFLSRVRDLYRRFHKSPGRAA